jgi:hypothetical protein
MSCALAARARTLRADLERQLERILEQPAARDWLRSAMELRFWLHQLPQATFDPSLGPVDGALLASLQASSRMFLDEVLWRGQLSDLLTSRVAFLDSRLASGDLRRPHPGWIDARWFHQDRPACRPPLRPADRTPVS